MNRQLIDIAWKTGFKKAAEAVGVTNPVDIDRLIVMHSRLQQMKNYPDMFKSGFDKVADGWDTASNVLTHPLTRASLAVPTWGLSEIPHIPVVSDVMQGAAGGIREWGKNIGAGARRYAEGAATSENRSDELNKIRLENVRKGLPVERGIDANPDIFSAEEPSNNQGAYNPYSGQYGGQGASYIPYNSGFLPDSMSPENFYGSGGQGAGMGMIPGQHNLMNPKMSVIPLPGGGNRFTVSTGMGTIDIPERALPNRGVSPNSPQYQRTLTELYRKRIPVDTNALKEQNEMWNEQRKSMPYGNQGYNPFARMA